MKPLSLLDILLTIRDFQGPPLLDIGGTFSLMQHNIWCKIRGADETLMSCGNQEFALAGTLHWDCKESPGPSTVQHQAPGELLDPIYILYVLDNKDLAFPVILGLNS